MSLYRYTVYVALCFWAMIPATAGAEPEKDNLPSVRLSTMLSEGVENDVMAATIRIEAATKSYTELELQHLLQQEGVIKESEQADALTQSVNQRAAELVRRAGNWPQLVIKTQRYSTQPMRYRSRITGWTVQQAIEVKSTDQAALTKLLGQIGDLGVIEGVQFTVSPEREAIVKESLRTRAILAFTDKAESIAEDFGYAGYDINSVTVSDNSARPMPMYREVAMSARADSVAPSLPAGENSVSVTVDGSIHLKNKPAPTGAL